jgi:AcrR family transcriptional regulator
LLLDATLDLIAEHGPDGFSTRDVAKRAGVTYGLIHYYFGARRELLRQAIVDASERYTSLVNPLIEEPDWVPLQLEDPMPDRDRRAAMQLILHRDEYADLLAAHGVIRRRLEVIGARHADDLDPAHLKAALVAAHCLRFGWYAASQSYCEAVDATPEEVAVVEEVMVAVERAILDVAIDLTRRAR